MKWPLVKSKFSIYKLFSWQLSHLLIDSIWKEPDLTVPGIWPLCYSWIGYLQANGPPWVLLSFCVDHDCSCQQRRNAYNSNLQSYLGSFQMLSMIYLLLFVAEICSLLLISAWLPTTSWADGCQEPAPLAVRITLDWQMSMMYSYINRGLILSVIIPHTKQASSLAIAATATFLALPCLINL